jgi:hypothetical protein
MALTFTAVTKERLVKGSLYHVYEVTFDNSYPTGGEAVTAANFGLSTLRTLIVESKTNVAAKWARFDRSATKVVLESASAELTNASDQSAVVVRVVAIGV